MQLSVMRTRVSERLNEGASGPVFYPADEIDAALNEAQRFFCFLTLGLERTANWPIVAGQLSARMATVFTDWICVLRVTDGAGSKLRPTTLAELGALDPGWMSRTAAPQRYAAAGADLVTIYPQSSVDGYLVVTYARAPQTLVSDTDVPEIPEEYQPRLIDYAIYRLRQVEGLQEFMKTLKGFSAYIDAAKHYANYVRTRNRGAKYDKLPFELAKIDLTKLLGAQ